MVILVIIVNYSFTLIALYYSTIRPNTPLKNHIRIYLIVSTIKYLMNMNFK